MDSFDSIHIKSPPDIGNNALLSRPPPLPGTLAYHAPKGASASSNLLGAVVFPMSAIQAGFCAGRPPQTNGNWKERESGQLCFPLRLVIFSAHVTL
jgi:hypothetical protein